MSHFSLIFWAHIILYSFHILLSFQNHEGEKLQPTAQLFPTNSPTFQTYYNATVTILFGPTTLLPIIPTTFAPIQPTIHLLHFHQTQLNVSPSKFRPPP